MMLSVVSTICQANYWLAFCDLNMIMYLNRMFQKRNY